jgi:hypothetical protein
MKDERRTLPLRLIRGLHIEMVVRIVILNGVGQLSMSHNAEHVQQLGSESLLPNLMEVKG